ncbi:MAG: DUF4091 domain-containing protein [Armatimonadetes bacterium]|nr:DUF4091 domain-containing protein [Armatimonadota bacterium]
MRPLIALWLITGPAAALAQIQAHLEYEPPDPGPGFGPNLLLKAPVTASPHWSDRGPEFAVDGQHDNPGNHWAAENIPVQLTVHLPQPAALNCLRLWTFWDDRRYYQYCIEGSADGETWTLLADRRENRTPATATGETFVFPEATLSQVRVSFTHNSAGNGAGGHIVELEGYRLPPEQAAAAADRTRRWSAVPAGLQAGWGSTDVRYPRNEPPQADEAWSSVAWRGQRVSGQLLLWTRAGAAQVRLAPEPLRSRSGSVIPAAAISARFVRYVLADGKLVPDVLDTARRLDLRQETVRPVWVAIEVPTDARPGVYGGSLTVRAQGLEPLSVPFTLEVLPAVLPPPAQWTYWLDLWQNPYALARYHGVEPWSPAHLAILEPHLRLLADAGQKCITTTVVYRPWGTQTYDPYDSMVEWILEPDGRWRYDYTVFDRYVTLARQCGIRGAINCYSVSSWTGSLRYLDAATGDYVTVGAAPGSPEYVEHWGRFLRDFTAHLRRRGWLGVTALAMDEPPAAVAQQVLNVVRKAAPDLRVAMAGGNHPELSDLIDDWCVFVSPPLDPAIARERTSRGLPTTFYVCCGPAKPNTFTFSPPAEAEWLGWYAAAQGYTGFLRWAFDSWVRDPLWDTSYVTWPAGDCFLVYPGPRSSLRFERLRDGIVAYEQVRLVRKALAARRDRAARQALQALDQALSGFSYEAVQHTPAEETVRAAREALQTAARVAWPG